LMLTIWTADLAESYRSNHLKGPREMTPRFRLERAEHLPIGGCRLGPSTRRASVDTRNQGATLSGRWGRVVLGNAAIPSRSMPDKNFQTAPCGTGRTKRTKRGLIATPVNATLGVDLTLPLPLGTILSPLSPFLSAGYGQKIILARDRRCPEYKTNVRRDIPSEPRQRR